MKSPLSLVLGGDDEAGFFMSWVLLVEGEGGSRENSMQVNCSAVVRGGCSLRSVARAQEKPRKDL